MGQKAFAMAGKSVADMQFIDLYSCFPSAVEIGCAELGIAEDDPRGLTVDRRLAVFRRGREQLRHALDRHDDGEGRGKPGSFGLVTANGWYVTKHAIGVVLDDADEGRMAPRRPEDLPSDIDAMAHPRSRSET